MAKVPKIRFNGFTEEWSERTLSELSDKVSAKNVNKAYTETFTNSAEYGIISQRDFFDHDISNKENISGYYVVKEDDFVYNPRISKSAPVGPINRNKLGRTGIVSPLYTVFRPKSISADYLEIFFKQKSWNKYMAFHGNTGARLDRFSISDEVFWLMPIDCPCEAEQKEIYSLFSHITHTISQNEIKLEKLKNIKKSLLEKLFPQDGQSTPPIRFRGFNTEWATVPFGGILRESKEVSTKEDEDVLLSSAIEGMFLNSELFDHQRGRSNVGYRKVVRGMLILSAQNLHLGNANVNLRFGHGLVSPAYKAYYLLGVDETFIAVWVKREETKVFFDRATTAGASKCRKNINWDDLYQQCLAIPTDCEQEKIGKLMLTLDKIISMREKYIILLKHTEQALLEQMFVNKK